MDRYSIIGPPDKDHEVVPEETPTDTGEAAAPAAEISVPQFARGVNLLSETEHVSGPAEPAPVLPRDSDDPTPQAAGTDLDAALQALAQKAQYTSNASGAALALRQGADMVCRAASGNSAPDRGARLQIKTGLTAECLRSGDLLRCDNVMQDSRVDLESCKRLGIESIIIAPVHQGQSVVGVLELFSAHAYSFQERDVDTVKGLAAEIGKLLEQGQETERHAPVHTPMAPEPPLLDMAAPGETTCGACGAKIPSDAVFCTGCGSFQESKPAGNIEPAKLGWKARLSSRRLLVPAVFVAMALAVALAPIPRKSAGVAPAPKPAVQVAASAMAPKAALPPASSNLDGKAAVAPQTGNAGSAAASNPTIAKSVKQLLGGVSSDFSKLLPVNEKAEPPSNGDPNLKVWVDTRKGYYYCPGDQQYGHTERGSYMTQRQAESSYYIPAMIKPCM